MSSKIQESKNNYLKEKVETIAIRVPKGEKAKVQQFAKERGKSLNSYVVDLIYNDMSSSEADTNE